MMAYDERRILEMLHEDEISRHRAFEAIVRNFSEQLYWQIRHMVLSHDDANDILQNTFIKAWTNLDSFMGYSRISTWLYRIAINETLTFLNRQKPTIPIETDEDGEMSIADRLESDPYFDGDETERQLQAAIATLPDKQRLVFNMKYFNEMKYEEISEALGTSVGALKASFHIAVKKIEEYFNNSD
ncbi:MAG: sigma-70 family RNA polymerase sigma factor [Bacteroidaceae bacterium]|nr:sigma-70 family RNA polymerase sigma factor [Bacteroidaceae bacterium]